MFRDGRPYSIENGYVDDGLITSQPYEVRMEVFKWIKENIVAADKANDRHTSYGIKHILERDTEIYLTNNEFKDAMLMCGYCPVDENELNWTYCISEKSPAFDRKQW
jgi:hypothetical protein